MGRFRRFTSGFPIRHRKSRRIAGPVGTGKPAPTVSASCFGTVLCVIAQPERLGELPHISVHVRSATLRHPSRSSGGDHHLAVKPLLNLVVEGGME